MSWWRGPLGSARPRCSGWPAPAQRCPARGILTARGLALESGFAYGIARQLIEPVRASAGPGEWDELLDGAAGLAARVFDWAGAGSVEDDVPYATTHGLYWLAANLAARQPLVIAVDDAHWADAPSLRWLAHLAARIDGLPIALLLAARSGPDEPGIFEELRACPQCTLLPLRPLGSEATAALVRERLGGQADAELCRACHDYTGGNPFLLESLAAALREPGTGDPLTRLENLAPEPVARAVLRRVSQLGEDAGRLTHALAVLGGPAPVRHAAALAGQDIPDAARLADDLRAADVLAPGSVLEFAHPIVRAAVYESIPAGERALAHAQAARLLERDGADTERVALHLLRSEPAGSAQVVALLRAAAEAASGRGAPGPAAGYLRRALDEPPDPAARPALLLELGLALAGERSPAAPAALAEAVELTTAPPDHATAALLSARVLGIWAYHESVTIICRDALARAVDPGPAADSLEAELFANAMVNGATIGEALERAQGRLAGPGPSSSWRVNGALITAAAAQPPGDALDLLAPVLASGLRDVPPDSLSVVYLLLALIWSEELATASDICDSVLSAARGRGSMSMVAHASCLHSMIMRRIGRLDDAAADAALALEFKLATSPPLAVAWAAALSIEALTRLGRLDEADAVAAVAARREPPPGCIHTITFLQARGGLRVAQGRHAEALDDLLAAGEGWRGTRHRQSRRRVLAHRRGRRAGRAGTPAGGGRARGGAARAGAQGRHPGHARRGAPRARRGSPRGAPGALRAFCAVRKGGVAGRGGRPAGNHPGAIRAGARAGRPGRLPAPVGTARRRPWPAASRAGPRAAHRCRAAGRAGQAGAARGRSPAPAHRPHRPGRAHQRRTAGRRPRRRRPVQPADRPAPVHHPAHRRDPPPARLPEARHRLPGPPTRAAGRRAAGTGRAAGLVLTCQRLSDHPGPTKQDPDDQALLAGCQARHSGSTGASVTFMNEAPPGLH